MQANMDYADACGEPAPMRSITERIKLNKIMEDQYYRQYGHHYGSTCQPPDLNERVDFGKIVDHKAIAKEILSGYYDFDEEEYRLNMLQMGSMNRSQRYAMIGQQNRHQKRKSLTASEKMFQNKN